MQGALIGFGTIAAGHMDAYSKMKAKNLGITAVVDSSLERRRVKIISPGVRTYESIAEMFSYEKIDFIDICTPPHTHFDYICAGLNNNCHVICEKPLLLSTEQYKEILSLVKSGSKIVYPSHNYKFAPILRFIKKIVESEQFGQIVNGHFRTLRSGHAIGVPEWDPHWRRNPKISGGGIVRDHGPHSIYVACDICGQFPIAVSCITGNLKIDQYKDTEDTALLTLHFGDSFQFTIDLSWAASFRNTYYAISGSTENIIVENDQLIRTAKNGKVDRQSISSEFNDPSHKAWFQDMFLDFIDTVANPDKQMPLLKEAFITALVIEQAYISAKQGGKLVNLPPISQELFNI